MLIGFLLIVNCPFNKMQILCEATIGLEKSFKMMYSNLCLNSRETVPLRGRCNEIRFDYQSSDWTTGLDKNRLLGTCIIKIVR